MKIKYRFLDFPIAEFEIPWKPINEFAYVFVNIADGWEHAVSVKF